MRLFSIAEHARAVDDDHVRVAQPRHRIRLNIGTWDSHRLEPATTGTVGQGCGDFVQQFLRQWLDHNDPVRITTDHVGASFTIKMWTGVAHAARSPCRRELVAVPTVQVAYPLKGTRIFDC